jgi:hypothetical protein
MTLSTAPSPVTDFAGVNEGLVFQWIMPCVSRAAGEQLELPL